MLPTGEVEDIGVGSLHYYNRIRRENEFRQRSDRILVDSEVERRRNRHQQERESEVNARRFKLVELLKYEEIQNRELARQCLEHEQSAHRKALFETAEALRKKVDEHNKLLAENKYQLQFLENNIPLRDMLMEAHTKEIMKDRREIAKQVEQERQRMAIELELLNKQRSHFDEQLDREAQVVKGTKNDERGYMEENKAMTQIKREQKSTERQAEVEERLQLIEKIKQEEMIDEGSTLMRNQRKKEWLQKVLEDVTTYKQRKEREKGVEHAVDVYCTSFTDTSDKADNRRSKDIKRQELTQFMEYQKRLAQDDKCFEKYVDKRFADLAEEQRIIENKRTRKEREIKIQKEKEVFESQKEAAANRQKERNADRFRRAEMATTLKAKLEQFEEELRLEKKKIKENSMKYGQQCKDQAIYMKERKARIQKEEELRERQAMLQAELEYQKRIAGAMSENPLLSKMHPWRRTLKTTNNFK